MNEIGEYVGNTKIERLNAISSIITQADHWKPALDEITKEIRSFFIYDNLVVYLTDDQLSNMEVFYAKAVGRGKSAEADAAWGESIANQILKTRQTTLEIPEVITKERLKHPFILGVPINSRGKLLGALIFIRFGGPEFLPESILIAEFIALQISFIIDREKLLEKYRELKAQQDQTFLKDDFLSTITHELRNPLGFIKGYTTTLLRSDTTWDQNTQQEFLSIIDQETDQLQELIDNLLDSARLKSGQLKMKFQNVRLDSMLKDLKLRSQMNYPSVKISLVMEDEPKAIDGDSRRLMQVLENLINNAHKYAPNSEIQIKLEQDKHFSYFSIMDDGPGIPEQYLPHIFKRFFRNPEQSPNIHGSGLGLYICKMIIDAHHGKITVESQLNEGTTFHIAIPNSH